MQQSLRPQLFKERDKYCEQCLANICYKLEQMQRDSLKHGTSKLIPQFLSWKVNVACIYVPNMRMGSMSSCGVAALSEQPMNYPTISMWRDHLKPTH
jgi:hypothetical protein